MKVVNVLENYWRRYSGRKSSNIGIVFLDASDRPFEKGDIEGDFQWRRQVNYSKQAEDPEIISLVKVYFPEMTGLLFSRKAGCKMCPCSPGLVVKGPMGYHPFTKAIWLSNQ